MNPHKIREFHFETKKYHSNLTTEVSDYFHLRGPYLSRNILFRELFSFSPQIMSVNRSLISKGFP